MTIKNVKRRIDNVEKALVGLDNMHYSKNIVDVPNAIAYGDMVEFPNTVSIAVNANAITETLYADNKAAIVYATVGGVEVTINKAHIPNDVLAEWLGSPKEGAVRYLSGEANSPYFGIAWRQTYSDGTYAYIKLYKGKFTEPSITANTKKDTIEFQTREITGTFASTNFLKKEGDKEFTVIMATVEDDSEDYADEGKTWFDSIHETTGPEWKTGNTYGKGNYVLEDGELYRAKENHVAGADFESDKTKWDKVGK